MAEVEKRDKVGSASPESAQTKRDREMAEERRKFDENQERLRAQRQPKFIAEHTVTSGETLSHLALKYYGHATPPYWELIYEANKAAIGADPNRVRSGLVLNIPELPPNMK